MLIISIFIIVGGGYMTFVEFTTEWYYSSAIIDLFLLQHDKWKMYRNAKKTGVKYYLTAFDYTGDAQDGGVPDYYLYPIAQADGGIRYVLYAKDADNEPTFITENFQLIHKLKPLVYKS